MNLMVRPFISLLIGCVLSISSAHSQALTSRVCVEVISPFWEIHKSISPPEKSNSSEFVFDFCHSNPHGFGNTSASPKKPDQRLQCYQSVNEEVVLEIPNIFFTDCREDEYFDTLLDHYAYKWANRYEAPFSMVIYNKKHKFLKRGEFDKHSDVYQQIAQWNYFKGKTQFLMKKIEEGHYKPETIFCSINSVDSLGEPCPEELIRRFPEPISVEHMTPPK